MNDELQLGKYEFFPYDDERGKFLKELEQSEMTDEERKKSLEDMLEELRKRRKKKDKK